jgi:hypothetical protein
MSAERKTKVWGFAWLAGAVLGLTSNCTYHRLPLVDEIARDGPPGSEIRRDGPMASEESGSPLSSDAPPDRPADRPPDRPPDTAPDRSPDGPCPGGTPGNFGQPCGNCGGTYQCNGSCLPANPPGYGQPCECGGTINCGARCSKELQDEKVAAFYCTTYSPFNSPGMNGTFGPGAAGPSCGPGSPYPNSFSSTGAACPSGQRTTCTVTGSSHCRVTGFASADPGDCTCKYSVDPSAGVGISEPCYFIIKHRPCPP